MHRRLHGGRVLLARHHLRRERGLQLVRTLRHGRHRLQALHDRWFNHLRRLHRDLLLPERLASLWRLGLDWRGRRPDLDRAGFPT